MKTDIVLQRLDQEVFKSNKDTVTLKKEDAKLLLKRVEHLESLASQLLRSAMESNASTNIVVPFKK